MIGICHTGHREVFAQLARQLAASRPGAKVFDVSQELPPLDCEALICVWWRAATPLLPRLLPTTRLVLCLHDHASWPVAPEWGEAAHRADLVVVPTPALRELCARSGIAAVLQPEGVDINRFRPGRVAPGTGPRLRLGWCGDGGILSKRLDVLKRAAPLMARIGVDLVVHDRSTGGYLPDEKMPVWYQGLDAYVCISEHEGGPLTLLEAAASGLPLISTPVGVAPDLLTSGMGGLLLAADPTYPELQRAAEWLVAQRPHLAARGTCNRVAVAERYPIRYESLWRALIPAAPAVVVPVASPPRVEVKTAASTGKRILVIGETLGLGGAEKLTVHLANLLHETGHAVTVGTTVEAGGAFAHELHAGIPVESVPHAEAIGNLIDGDKPHLVLANNCHLMRETVERHYCQHSDWHWTTLLHGFVPWSLSLLPDQGLPERASVLTMTDGCRAGLLAARPGLDPARVHVIRTGIDTERFAPGPGDRSLLPWGADAGPIFGTAGRFSREKDLPGMVHVLAQIRETHPGARLVILGGSDPGVPAHQQYWDLWGERLHHAIQRTGQADVIHLAGCVVDVLPWYRVLDCFLLTSAFEDLPLVALEAQACGVPVVATAVGALPALLESGGGVTTWKLGEMMDDMEREHFAMAAIHAATAMRMEMGEKGRECILRDYSLAAMRERLCAYVDMVIA
jgi:glycosyltransferase involved in cell wall biosynthesis